MKRNSLQRAIKRVILASLCLCCAVIWADEPSADRTQSAPAFETFQIILDRNIFDPSRRPKLQTTQADRAGSEKTDDYEGTGRGATPFSAGAEYLAVTGALLYDTEAVAFITGSRPEYATVVRQGDTIAEFQVESIATNQIVLRNDERTITIPVGFGISRHGKEPWRVAALPGTNAYSGRAPDDADSLDDGERSELPDLPSADPDRDSGGTSQALLERLRQRRQQELDQ